MGDTFRQIVRLVERGEVQVSEHGYDELAADGILAREIVASISDGVAVEEYSDYAKGPCVLVLQQVRGGEAVHVVWGIPKGASSPAVLVTAYRPDPDRWDAQFLKRRK